MCNIIVVKYLLTLKSFFHSKVIDCPFKIQKSFIRTILGKKRRHEPRAFICSTKNLTSDVNILFKVLIIFYQISGNADETINYLLSSRCSYDEAGLYV